MEELFDGRAAREFIAEKFQAQGDFSIIDDETFEKMLTRVQALDRAYMEQSGVDDGGVYDDDEAFEQVQAALMEAFPEHKMYAMRFAEDYLDYSEEYLEESGLIDWD